MKVKVRMKAPDALRNAIDGLTDACEGTDEEAASLGRQLARFCERWFQSGEYVTLVLDDNAESCTVIAAVDRGSSPPDDPYTLYATMKCPDALAMGIWEALHETDLSERKKDERFDEFSEFAGRWFEYGERITLKIDTQAGTCVVISRE